MTYAKDAAPPFYHGTRADLTVGDLLGAGYASNYGAGKAASWGAELAQGDGRERVYIVEPTAEFVDDPNLTDTKFPGNPTEAYRSQAPLRITGEVADWTGHTPEQLQAMKDFVARLKAQGVEAID